MIFREAPLSALSACLRANPGLVGETPPRIDPKLWPAVVARANAHFLGPALFASIAAAGALQELPGEVSDYLYGLYHTNRRRNRIARRQALELVREFNRDGIEPLLLKGTLTLLAEPRLDTASQMMTDIDVAVQRRCGPAAMRALHRLHYTVRDRQRDDHHSHATFGRDGDPVAIGLHFELIDRSDILPAAEVWGRARKTTDGQGTTFLRPWPTHRILHNILHAQVQAQGAFYRASLDLSQLHELALLSKAYGAAIHWEHVRDRLERHRLVTPLLSYLWAAHRLMGSAWPYAEGPDPTVRAHFWLCRAQLRRPGLRPLGAPWGHLGSALAQRRRASWYGAIGRHCRLRHHVRHVLSAQGLSFVIGRLFRP